MGKNENIEIRRILDIVKSKKLVILMILIISILLGYLYSYHYIIPEYKATSTLLLIPNSASEGRVVMTSDLMVNADLTVNSGLIETYRSIGENSKVLKQIIHNLELDMTEEELLEQMKVSVVKDTYVIQVAVTNRDPKKAMEIATEFDKVFLGEIKEIYHLDNIGVVDEARLPEKPCNIHHTKDMILFFMIGLGISCASITLFYLFDNTIKKEEEIEKYIHLKSLGTIPIHQDDQHEIVNRSNAKSYVTECINTIRTNILYMNSAKNAKTILITSCTPREGKSWVSANIATAFAETDKRVLLIDADMRKGRAHKIFKVQNEEGLSNYLYEMTGDKKEDMKLGKKYIKETKIPNLHILTNGNIPPNPSELLESNNMKNLLEILKNIYDVIILDAPPCKLVTDSIILSTIVDSTILVANAERTKMRDFDEVKKAIQMVDGEIIGAILNKKKVPVKTYSKGYYYANSQQSEMEKGTPEEMISVDTLITAGLMKLEEETIEVVEAKIEKGNQEGETVSVSIENRNDEEMKLFINKELKKIQEKYHELVKEMKDTSYLENLLKEAEEKKLTQEQVKNIIEQEVGRLNQDKLTKEQVRDIIGKEVESLNQDKLTKEQVRDIIGKEVESLNQDKLTQEQVRDIIEQEVVKLNHNKLTQQQVETIIKQEMSHVDYTEEIHKIYSQLEETKQNTSEAINEMIKRHTEELMHTIRNQDEKEENMQLLLKEKMNQMQEETIKLLQKEIIKIDYSKQILQMNEMLTNLKDSYLELANKVRTNQMEIEENEKENNKNIIDFRALKKQKNRKKVFSIEEEISYEDLEQGAAYIIPLRTKRSGDDSLQNVMY